MMFFSKKGQNQEEGFSLFEVIVGLAVFAVVGTAIYVSYNNVLQIIITSQANSVATAVVNNELEIIRNIPYPDVGLRGGSPAGSLEPTKTVWFGNLPFTVETTVRNVDDPFDGTVTSIPPDLIPADYKLVEIAVSCANCPQFKSLTTTTTVATRGLEKATRNGALFIKVFDAFGQAVAGAQVSVKNSAVIPLIDINDITNASGSLNFVDIATSSVGYRISVTKSGYSTERTYPLGDVNNPNPVKPDPIVFEQGVTNVSFSIDRLSNFSFKAADKICRPLAGVEVLQTGEKLIGYNPDFPKFSVNFSTDANGQHVNNVLEWDTYDFKNLNQTYALTGYDPFLPLAVSPASSSEMRWVLQAKKTKALLVTINDEADSAVDDAAVNLSGTGFNQTKFTGQAIIEDTDWSPSNFSSKSMGLEVDNPTGEIHLQASSGSYAYPDDQKLISTTLDMGTSNVSYLQLSWTPTSQPVGTTIKFQVAANNDNLTWNFVGPNGNSNTFFTVSGTDFPSAINNKRYLRYKVFMNTTDPAVTPRLEDLSFNFHSGCLTGGQAYFDGLSGGDYTISITKTGFDPIDDIVSVLDDWQEFQDTLWVP